MTAAGRSPWTLGREAQRWLLVVHLLLTALLVGGLAAILLLGWVGDGATEAATRGALDRAAFVLGDTLVNSACLAFVATGLAFSLGTPWGFGRYRWIVAKWLLLVGLGAGVWLWLAPAAAQVAALADVLGDDAGGDPTYAGARASLRRAALVLLAAALLAVGLSVFKPGGARHPPRPRRRQGRWVGLALAGGTVLGSLLLTQFWTLHALRARSVPAVDVDGLGDGSYEGAASDGSFTYRVRVDVRAGRVVDVRVLANRRGLYAGLAERVVVKVLRAQRVDLDGVSGATTTSKVLLQAIAEALRHPPR